MTFETQTPQLRPTISTRNVVGAVLCVSGLALASCSSGSDDNAAANDGDSSGQAGSEAELEELQSDLEADLEELQDAQSSDSGSGVVTIDGIDYAYDPQICIVDPDFGQSFEAAGPGETADGVAYWASITSGVQQRSLMEAAGMDSDALDIVFGERDSIESLSVSVELGKDDQFSSAEDSMPDFNAFAIDIENADDLSYTIDGNTLSGSGSVNDSNGIAADFNVSLPATFSATCG